MPVKLDALQEAFRQQDAETLRLQAHGMKSSGYLLGLSGFAGLCQELESTTAVGELDAAGELIMGIEAEYGRLEEKMLIFLKDAKQGLT